MSEYTIHLIPKDASYIPPAKAQKTLLEYVIQLDLGEEDIVSVAFDHVRFQDCGANFSKISCPNCSADISVDRWQACMNRNFNGKEFDLKPFSTLCCNFVTNLNELIYDFPQGFSKYRLSIINPKKNIKKNESTTLEKILGCQLNIIHYHL